MIRRRRRALEHVAAVIGTVRHLVFIFGRQRLDDRVVIGAGAVNVLRKTCGTGVQVERSAFLAQIAERHEVKTVAVGADGFIDLITALQRILIIFSENAGKMPLLAFWMLCAAAGRQSRRMTG